MEIDACIPAHPMYPHFDKVRAYAIVVSKRRMISTQSAWEPTANRMSPSKRRRTNTGFAEGTWHPAEVSERLYGSNTRVSKEEDRKWPIGSCSILRTKESTRESWPCYMRLLLRECKILISQSMEGLGERAGSYVAALRVIEALIESSALRLIVAEPYENWRSLAELVHSLLKQAARLCRSARLTALKGETKLFSSK